MNLRAAHPSGLKDCPEFRPVFLQSSAPSFVAQFANLHPGSAREVGLQTFPFKRGFSDPEPVSSLMLRNNPPETLFDEGLEGSPLSVGQLTSLFKEAIWYLYGRFHMANHIVADSEMSSADRLSSDSPPLVEDQARFYRSPLPLL